MNPIIQQYFTAFAAKDLITLSELYSDNIVLWEWGQNIFMGKQEVLAANQQLFESTQHLMVTVQGYASNEDHHYCELSIVLDDALISVVDVIVTNEGKITSVQAYRGF